ncbi:corticosteroid-binding globulin isoform X1 [Otolemur garnettii]|uniref:corticosteroid-binding globulin isoform X1 n=1 Tax=Otolemur garnettii TaxID=30611 RepID=UPI0002740151|nr:corticosteroid-binding globulin isoform X1 [Otolemur garnettii]
MLLVLYTCLLWLSTSGLWTIQAEHSSADVNAKNHHRGLAPANVDFAFSLYKHLVALTPDKNIFISPVSISMALAMLSLGTWGHTRTQLLQGLGFNLTEMAEAEIHQSFQHLHHLLEESATSLEMTMGNALFFDHSLELLETFLTDMRHFYDSEALATDFQEWDRASRQINEYVQNKTQGKIVNLFSELNSPANLILINYIFFKGTWTQPFDPNSTREENFYVNETTVMKVPMMFQSRPLRYLRDSELPCQLLQLNYVGNGTIFFILPDQGKMDTVINALSRDTIQRWSNSLNISRVNLYIPKVSISGAYDLRHVLAELGIGDLFTSNADFSGIIQEGQLRLSKVVHKAVLQLDEEGVQASASRVVTPYLTSSQSFTINVSFNRPFLILVFDHFTWSSLFLGKFVKPT